MELMLGLTWIERSAGLVNFPIQYSVSAIAVNVGLP
jgi:hypothetical protein